MVLIVVALVAGAVAVGGDVQRNAAYQRLGSSFVRGWQLAYMSYQTKWGVVILDSQTTPTGFVNQNTSGSDTGGSGGVAEVCGNTLRSAMAQAGVDMPEGRAEGLETRYSYQDSNGNPQELEVCFRSIPWLTLQGVDGSGNATYTNQVHNVMVIKRATPDLARMIDSLVDNARDAQFGKVRQFPNSSTLTNTPQQVYSLDNTCVQNTSGSSGAPTCSGTAYDEAQVATMTIYYLMDN